jgi:hypothetical protein
MTGQITVNNFGIRIFIGNFTTAALSGTFSLKAYTPAYGSSPELYSFAYIGLILDGNNLSEDNTLSYGSNGDTNCLPARFSVNVEHAGRFIHAWTSVLNSQPGSTNVVIWGIGTQVNQLTSQTNTINGYIGTTPIGLPNASRHAKQFHASVSSHADSTITAILVDRLRLRLRLRLLRFGRQ